MIRLYQERDRVILDLGQRSRSHTGTVDVLLSVLQAQCLAENLRLAANGAERAALAGDRAPCLGVWDLRVVSFDRRVGLRIWPPLQLAASEVLTVPVPYLVARQLADRIELSRQTASYGIRYCTPRGVAITNRRRA